MSSHEGPAPRAGMREWIGLAVLALPTLLVSLDMFVVLLALPHISRGLHANSVQQLWIIDVYGFMVAGFMITMGTLGDRIGRRRLLLAGAAVFGVASIAAAWSASAPMLIAVRALLGVAGAALTPSTLSLITHMFRDPRQKASAIGVWAGCFTVGAIIGPIVGGVMLERFWWGSVFLLGVPAMVLLLVVGPVLLPEYRDEAAGRLDLPSVVLSLAAVLPAVQGLKSLAGDGWRVTPALLVVVGFAVGVVFVRRQRRLADPLLDLRLFAGRTFSATLGSMLVYSMLSGGTMALVAQYFQLVDGLSPLRAGLALAPGMAASVVGFQIAPLLARRIRPAHLIAGGVLVTAAGLLVMTRSGTSGPIVLILGFLISCLGTAPLVTLGTNLIIGAAPPERAGSAAAMGQTGGDFGYALGVAVLGSVMTAVYRARIPADAPAAARDGITGAIQAAHQLPGQAGAALVSAADRAFAAGLHTVAALSAAILVGVAILLATTLRHLPPLGRPQPDPTSAQTAPVETVHSGKELP
ncbi:MFS transporter [Planotetraspora thailandica]|uniref:MFS transporter n=1 Tax=Planotetraspora thailandica TaxID=487172 RepID=A0A8J3UYA5_9ACTN|nr:MFS transporter [Planotetraspora thailandica]GII53468.1 MFS transporter [Planotetraspora thailandica]